MAKWLELFELDFNRVFFLGFPFFLFFSFSLSFFPLLLHEHLTLFRRASQLPINMFATAYATRCVIIPFNKIQFDLWTICASWIIDITMEKREQSAICCGQTENIPHQRPIMCKFSLSVDVVVIACSFFCFVVFFSGAFSLQTRHWARGDVFGLHSFLQIKFNKDFSIFLL